MQPLIYLVACSLDGYIARADHRVDYFATEGSHVSDYLETLKSFDSVVMGRKTYDVGLKAGVKNPYPFLETYVVSRSLDEGPDPNVHVIREDATESVRSLKQRSGRGIYLCGGAELGGQLLGARLIDQIVLKVSPVLIGKGIPVFASVPAQTSLSLEETKPYDSGVVLMRYRVLGSQQLRSVLVGPSCRVRLRRP